MSLKHIVGPMFAGKTLRLYTELSPHEGLKKPIAYIKPAKDQRGLIKSTHAHISPNEQTTIVEIETELLASVDIDKYAIIAVDEVQFFPDLITTVKGWLAKDKRIITAGLDGDINQEPIGDSLKLIPLADEIVKICAMCIECDKEDKIVPAPFTIRRDGRKDVIEEVGTNPYKPVCRKHRV